MTAQKTTIIRQDEIFQTAVIQGDIEKVRPSPRSRVVLFRACVDAPSLFSVCQAGLWDTFVALACR